MAKYDEEFKRQAIKKYLDGQSIASISRETGVSEGVLHTAVGKIKSSQKMEKPTRKSWRCESGF